MTTKAQHETEEPTQAQLEANAATLTKEIGDLDGQIKGLSGKRTQKHKELRAITSKLVTLKLKEAR